MSRYNNRIISAAAGTGKTTLLIKHIEENFSTKRILYLTYTNFNLDSMRKDLCREIGLMPSNVVSKSWTQFLLNDFVTPYRKVMDVPNEVTSIHYSDKPIRNRKSITSEDWRYYIPFKGSIYYERIAQFSTKCITKFDNRPISRLEKMYDIILIDEVQDLASYDLEIIKALYQSKIELIIVGDHRQSTYTTTSGAYLKKYSGSNIFKFFSDILKHPNIEALQTCHRCHQSICDIASQLFEELNMVSSVSIKDGHLGVYVLNEQNLQSYIEKFDPQILIQSKNNRLFKSLEFSLQQKTLSMGKSKGLSFERVLIFPTKDMVEFLRTGNVSLAPRTLAQFYVALTRAKKSVAIVTNHKNINGAIRNFNGE